MPAVALTVVSVLLKGLQAPQGRRRSLWPACGFWFTPRRFTSWCRLRSFMLVGSCHYEAYDPQFFWSYSALYCMIQILHAIFHNGTWYPAGECNEMRMQWFCDLSLKGYAFSYWVVPWVKLMNALSMLENTDSAILVPVKWASSVQVIWPNYTKHAF